MKESGIIGQLGINWKLFLSQGVNFVILLIVLRHFVYKPLLSVIKKRNERIKEGLEKAAIADTRLKEVDVMAKNTLKKADSDAVAMMKATEERAKQLEQSLQKKAEEKQVQVQKQMEAEYEKQREEAYKKVSKEASQLVKQFIVKTVELKPEAIDDALIKKAMAEVVKNHEV